MRPLGHWCNIQNAARRPARSLSLICRNTMWIDEYERLLTSPDHPFQEAVDLKRQHFPELIFKYRKIDAENLDALKSGYVWLAPASSLNDLYDCATALEFDTVFEDIFRSQARAFLANPSLPQPLTEAQILEVLASKSPKTRAMELMLDAEGGLSPERKVAFQRDIASIFRVREGLVNESLSALSRSHLKVCAFSADGTVVPLRRQQSWVLRGLRSIRSAQQRHQTADALSGHLQG
jgi:hypothetical protein